VADTEPVVEGVIAKQRSVYVLPKQYLPFYVLIVTDSEARQVAEKTLIAEDSALPEHFSVMLPATCCSRVPQRLLRSDGLGWALQTINI
jgi:hypothetical protein